MDKKIFVIHSKTLTLNFLFMKTLKHLTIVGLLLISNHFFAQNTLPTSGNVGIGTTNPSVPLEVNGNAVIDSSLTVADSLEVGNKLKVQQDLKVVGQSVFVHKGKFKDKLTIDGLTRMNAAANAIALCPSYSDVDIGNFNPEARLHVYAPTKTGLVVETFHNGDYIYNIQSKVNRDLTKAIAVYNTNSNEETFKVNGNGHVYATKVLVRNTPFPDYVFEKEYDLMPLAELEQYIKTNKHLPNMPTATTVESEGADLGEINRVLVEKTEELTLYVIELKKELEQLKEELNELKKQ